MIQIREALAEDAGLIRLLAEAVWWPTYRSILEPEQIRYMLDEIYDQELIAQQITTGLQNYLLLEDNNALGFASYAPRERSPGVYKLHKLYCLPETKGKGYGKKMLEAVEEKAIAQGVSLLELNVNKYNPAKGFYGKMGFEVVGEEDIPIGPYWMNDFIMRKNLQA